ncbi:MAG: transketolase, partial [Tissierellia bacterium]|nr:transketolase [Tissierellia bacterium]
MNLESMSTQTIRYLAVDAVNRAKSGHPGLPMGAAPMAKVLFRDHLRFNPEDPHWLGRDRFVLSAGHGSALLYSLLHLHGYELSIEDLMAFRQVGSKTPGHPEYRDTAGVETTTGPLGQGLANAVGMAMASKKMAGQYGELFDNYTYVLVGDGDLMEGITSEASSLAGHLKLEKLIVLYDSNNITIDGRTDITFTENVRARYEAYGWKTFFVSDGNDEEAISQAIAQAKESDAPSFIEIKTIIGYGSPNKSDTSAAHGAPLGEEETALTKKAGGWDFEETFFVPEEVKAYFEKIVEEKKKDYTAWMERFQEQNICFPSIKEGALEALLEESGVDKATRIHGQVMLNRLKDFLPNLFGGSADLAGSNMTTLEGEGHYSAENPTGKNINFGIREHAMAAIVNGIAIHGIYRPFGATFLSFADYMKPSVRLAALMKIPSVFIFTHDSIGVGEDGPT